MDDDLARIAGDLDAFARELVEPAAPVVHGRVHRRHLLDSPHEGTTGFLHLLPAEGGDHRRRQHGAAEVPGVGDDAETQLGDVLLVLVGEV